MFTFNALKGAHYCLLFLTLQGWILRDAQATVFPSPSNFKCPSDSVLMLDATANPQTIESNNFPHQYENNDDCRFKITAPGGVIKINLVFYNIATDGRCKDSLKIYDGVSTKTTCMKKFCGAAQSSLEIFTSTNEVFIVFETDSSVTSYGYRLRFQNVHGDSDSTPSSFKCEAPAPSYPPNNDCPANSMFLDATSDPQILHSKNYPNYYPQETDCWWKIRAPRGVINITVFYHDISASLSGVSDTLTIYDGASSVSTVCKVTLTGISQSRASYISSTNEAYLHWLTDSHGSERGFFLKYQYVDENTSPTIPCTPLVPVSGSEAK